MRCPVHIQSTPKSELIFSNQLEIQLKYIGFNICNILLLYTFPGQLVIGIALI